MLFSINGYLFLYFKFVNISITVLRSMTLEVDME